MKKLINEAFRMQQLAGIKPLYESYYGAKATPKVYLTDIEINGVTYEEIVLILDAKSSDEYGEKADWEIKAVDSAMLSNGQKITDRAQLNALLPHLLNSGEVNQKIENELEYGFDWDEPSDRYDWDDVDGRGDR